MRKTNGGIDLLFHSAAFLGASARFTSTLQEFYGGRKATRTFLQIGGSLVGVRVPPPHMPRPHMPRPHVAVARGALLARGG